MPQTSLPYASGRVGVLRRSALKRSQLDRLLSAQDKTEADRTLSDIGFTSPDGGDFQAATEQRVLIACELIRSITPEPLVTDCYLLRYDIHNLKILFKSRHLAQKPQFLSACGTLNVDKLRHYVAEHTYASLPAELKAAMERLEKQSATHFDPMFVDTILDQAMYRQIFLNLSQSRRGEDTKKYFSTKADLQNLVMLLRLRAMGREPGDFLPLALPGGRIKPQTFLNAYAESERLARQVRRYGDKVYQAALAATADAAKLPFLEKTADDYLYGFIKAKQYDTDSIEYIIAYLLQKQRESTDVRLVMTGKLNGFAPEAVGERMRELDG